LNTKAGHTIVYALFLVTGLTYRFSGDKKKSYLQQLEAIVKVPRNGRTPPSPHSDEFPRHQCQKSNQRVIREPEFNNDMIAQGSALELPSHSYHLINPEAGNGLDLPGIIPGIPSFDPIPGESIDELQRGMNFLDQNSTIPHSVDPTLALYSDNIFPRRLSTAGQDSSGVVEADFLTSHEDDQQALARIVNQASFQSSRLSNVLRSEDGVSQKYSLEDILITGIRTLSKGERQPRNDISANITSTTDTENDTRKVLPLTTPLETCEFPDIHLNTIQLTTMSFVAACFANAAMLGLSPEILWDKTTQSPFYQAWVGNEPSEAANAEQFAHIKPLLRPSTTQLTHPHHPYLDILPFPAFRNRIIQLIQIQPPAFDPDQLCRDLRSDGIICWGSTRSDRSDPMTSGAPWDIRSWEVKSWFLKKWWMLFDGPDGEMYQHSRWWCEMRGEKSSYPW
jgi:hypothetical protein